MTLNLTRRQVMRAAVGGGVALASTAVASGPFALTNLAGPATAQASGTVLLGVRAGPISPGEAPEGIPLLVQSVEFSPAPAQTVQIPQVLQDGTTPLFRVHESISGWAALADGSLVIAITGVAGGNHELDPSRLTRLSQGKATTVPISGLQQNEQLGSLVTSANGALVGMVEKRNGTPPQRIVTIDPQSGAIIDRTTLPLTRSRRYANLTQCFDGQLYATMIGKDGETSLILLDTGATLPLTEDGVPWNNGLAGLVCPISDQLIALTAPRYGTLNGLYKVDPHSGAMARVRDFDVAKLTATPPSWSSAKIAQ